MNSYSQIGQDLKVLQYLNNKRCGFFLDIGCGFPSYINNTYLLEKEFDWSGLSIDLLDCPEPRESPYASKTWTELRPSSNRILADALKIDYRELLSINNVPKIIDFLSFDLEPPDLTLECLFRIPFDEYQFRVICFETDEYRPGGLRRMDISRKYLETFGYKLVETLKWGGENTNQDDLYIKQI